MRAPFSMQMFVFEFFSAFRSSSFCNFLASFKEGTERPPPGEGIQTHSPSFKCHKSKEK